MATFGDIPSTSADFYFGYVYRIDCAGKFYIGKKQFTENKNYRNYKSSSDEMKELIKNNPATYSVLEYAISKRELTYMEVKYQFLNNCLEDENCLNKNINGCFWRGRLV